MVSGSSFNSVCYFRLKAFQRIQSTFFAFCETTHKQENEKEKYKFCFEVGAIYNVEHPRVKVGSSRMGW